MYCNQKIVIQLFKFPLAFLVPEFSCTIWKRPCVKFPQRFLLKGTHIMSSYTVNDKVGKL